MRTRKIVLIWLSLSVACCTSICGAQTQQVQPKQQTLKNGIKVIALHVPDSKNVSIITFLPMYNR